MQKQAHTALLVLADESGPTIDQILPLLALIGSAQCLPSVVPVVLNPQAAFELIVHPIVTELGLSPVVIPTSRCDVATQVNWFAELCK